MKMKEESQSPLLSIVIPTRNRQKYCIAAIEDILSYDYPSLELCIQDNSDDDLIARHIAARPVDGRLKYRYEPERLNSVHNMDRAVGLAEGRYVIMIGDDDTILPEIFEAVQWAEENDIDSVCSSQTVAYYWPGAYPGQESGVLALTAPSRKKVDNLSIDAKLEKLFSRGITRFLDYRLPKLYHGLIRVDRLQTIRIRTGHYFGGLSPDIYSTMALCAVVEKHMLVDKAISVSGACRASSTSQNIHQGHRGELKDAPHLILRGPYTWDDRIPAYYSVETIWAESALKACQEMEIKHLPKKFSYPYLVAFSALNNRNIFRFAMEKSLSKENRSVRESRLLRLKIGFSMVRVAGEYIVRNLRRRLSKGHEKTEYVYGVEDISQAVKIYCSKQ